MLLVPADRIMSLELAPLDPRGAVPAVPVVTTIDGPDRLLGPGTADAQVDAMVALRTALGRPAG